MRGAALKVALSALESLGYRISKDPNGQNGASFLHHIFMFFSRRMEQKTRKKMLDLPNIDVGFAQHQSNIISQTTQKTVCFLKKTPWCFFCPTKN